MPVVWLFCLNFTIFLECNEFNLHILDCNEADRFKCGDGTCILKDKLCDGRRHCPDFSDEKNCRKYCISTFLSLIGVLFSRQIPIESN